MHLPDSQFKVNTNINRTKRKIEMVMMSNKESFNVFRELAALDIIASTGIMYLTVRNHALDQINGLLKCEREHMMFGKSGLLGKMDTVNTITWSVGSD